MENSANRNLSKTMPLINLIPFQVHSAAINMAYDEFMLRSPGSYLRLYGWQPTALSFGRNQSHYTDIDSAYCQKIGIESVKRLTGGRTVLHQNEITYSFASDNSFFSDSILKTYRMIAQPIYNFLIELGLNPEMKKESKGRSSSSICFKQTSAYEITIDSKKLVGSAQFRNSKRFLQHGSILVDIDWDLWRAVWKSDRDQNGLQDRVTCLNTELASVPTTAELEKSLVRQFELFFGSDSRIIEFDEGKLKAIETYSQKYHQLF